MQSGVHHEPARAHLDRLQIAQLAERIVGVHAELVAHLLRVQGPAFDIGVERQHGADQRQAVGEHPLPDVPRNPLVEGEGRQGELRPVRGVLEVDVVAGGPCPIDRAVLLIAVRRAVLDFRRHALDDQVRLREGGERLGQPGAHGGDDPVQIVDELGAPGIGVGEEEARILVERRDPLADRSPAQPLGFQQDVHLGGQGAGLLKAHGVHVVGA